MAGNTKKPATRVAWVTAVVGACVVGIVCLVLPPSLGRPVPIRDANGEVVPGSISEKSFVHLNGTDLGLFIMAEDARQPVLLFLGGGPGIPAYFLEQLHPSGLEKEFVVAFPEYRGTSLPYHPDEAVTSLTTEQYIADAVAMTNHLRERFAQDKIYLLGHSFGTSIGLQETAHSHVGGGTSRVFHLIAP